jgi:dephospho-CoA kinase
MRDEQMAQAAANPQIRAWIWDAPLLAEAGWAKDCDAIVFVDAPLEVRQARVLASRGWNPAELAKREKMQMGLDKKAEMAKYTVRNTAGAGNVRSQVRHVLSRVLAGSSAGKA